MGSHPTGHLALRRPRRDSLLEPNSIYLVVTSLRMQTNAPRPTAASSRPTTCEQTTATRLQTDATGRIAGVRFQPYGVPLPRIHFDIGAYARDGGARRPRRGVRQARRQRRAGRHGCKLRY